MMNRRFLLVVFVGVILVLILFKAGVPVAQMVDPDMDLRRRLAAVYTGELGVVEATGNNDGERVEEYLQYTHLSGGYDWCAAFVSWCYAQVGRSLPRNPWSPALFPEPRVIWKNGTPLAAMPQRGDVFGIWNAKLQRIAHVGFIDRTVDHYFLTVEGNSDNAVRSLRRPMRSIYRIADWVRP